MVSIRWLLAFALLMHFATASLPTSSLPRKTNVQEEYLSVVASSALAVKQRVLQDAGAKKAAKAVSQSVFNKLDKDGKRVLTYYGLMFAGAMARTCAATAVHPLNVVKTMLQTKGGVMPELKWSVLSRGAGSQFIMSIPHGAINFVVTEVGNKPCSVYLVYLLYLLYLLCCLLFCIIAPVTDLTCLSFSLTSYPPKQLQTYPTIVDQDAAIAVRSQLDAATQDAAEQVCRPAA